MGLLLHSVLVGLLLLCCGGPGGGMMRVAVASSSPVFRLQGETKTREALASLLDEAVLLHQAVYSGQGGRISLHALKIINQIKGLRGGMATFPVQAAGPGGRGGGYHHELSYRNRLLVRIERRLEALLLSPRGGRSSQMNRANLMFSNLALAYGFKKYVVFFCSRDRSVWMQTPRHKKALHLSHKDCGQPVGAGGS